MACTQFTVYSCKCVPKNTKGGYALVQVCKVPHHPTCSGDNTSLKCICS